MKLITRDTDYALRALIFISKHKQELISVSDLVKDLKIPRPFLRKILQLLNKRGVLKSYKGTKGGFLLAKPAEKIFLLDLMQIFQGKFSLNECFFKKIVCPDVKKCVLKKKLNNIERYVLSELRAVTVASLLE